MANLTTTTNSRGPHVRDLFVGGMGEGLVTYENKESKKMFSIPSSSKNKRAPPPPKLGQYRPKILQATEAEVPVRAREATPPETTPSRRENRVNAIIIGDKDVPMTLAPRGADSDEDDAKPSSPLHRSMPNGLGQFPPRPGSPHPTASHYPDTTSTEVLVTYDPGQPSTQGHVNPAFHDNGPRQPHSPTSSDAPVAPPRYKKRTATSRRVLSPRRQEEEEIEGVAIPAPDYDEDEKTLVFDAEAETAETSANSPMFRDFMGEDFAKYLPDDTVDVTPNTHSLRPRPSPGRKSLELDKRAQTEGRRYKPRKRAGADKKKGSLRHFSFADSKLATADGGREGRRPKSLDMTYSDMTDDTEVFMENESYETYLNSRHGNLQRMRSNSSGDSSLPDMSGAPRRQNSKKDTVWKKLTWKLKRRVSGYSLPT